MRAVDISRARLYEVALPLREPFTISGGTLRVRRSLLVELEDADGARGYGESAPFEAPFYSSETTASARACLSEWLLPRVVAHPVSDSEALDRLLKDGIRGNQMARAGVETAWWDLVAARTGVSLVELVTQRLAALEVKAEWLERTDAIECGIAIGIPDTGDLDTLRRDVKRALDRGYRRVKLKVRPGWDIAPARAALEIIHAEGREVPLTVDANGAYELGRHDGELEHLDSLGVLYIEQPLAGDALWDLAALGRRCATAICLDESLASDGIARQILAMGGPTVWNLKLQRVGGLEEACRIYARATDAGVRLWAGTMPETGVGAQAMLALACHSGFVYPSDLEPSERWYPPDTDLIELRMTLEGTMPVPTERVIPDMSRAKLVFETS